MDFTEEHRPRTPDELIGKGQRAVATGLLEQIEDGTLPRSILFAGPTGVGKTTIALMLANKLVPEHAIEHVNCNVLGIDDVRNRVLKSMRVAPTMIGSPAIVWILDELDGFGGKAQKALLTDLEKIPGFVYLFAATTELGEVDKMVRGRFDDFELGIPSEGELKRYIAKLLGEHGYPLDSKVTLMEEEFSVRHVALDIYMRAEGSVREAVKYVGMVTNGTYQLLVPHDEEDEDSLPFMFLYKNAPLEALIERTKSIQNYDGEAAFMTSMARNLLIKGGADSPNGKQVRARAAIHYFGPGFPHAYTSSQKEGAYLSALISSYMTSR